MPEATRRESTGKHSGGLGRNECIMGDSLRLQEPGPQKARPSPSWPAGPFNRAAEGAAGGGGRRPMGCVERHFPAAGG